MMPLDLTRLASPAACWPPCAAGWRSCAPPAAPAAAGPAAPGPRPLLAAVGPAGGAGVLIRILRWMLVIGAVSDDVIGSLGNAGRIRGVRAGVRAFSVLSAPAFNFIPGGGALTVMRLSPGTVTASLTRTG